jgi:fatty-acyl-CoA synthase
MMSPRQGCLISTFDPLETLNTISHEQCTHLYGVPTMFISQLEHPQLYNLSSLRGGITAGSLCPSSLMKQLIQKMNLTEITNCYGMA